MKIVAFATPVSRRARFQRCSHSSRSRSNEGFRIRARSASRQVGGRGSSGRWDVTIRELPARRCLGIRRLIKRSVRTRTRKTPHRLQTTDSSPRGPKSNDDRTGRSRHPRLASPRLAAALPPRGPLYSDRRQMLDFLPLHCVIAPRTRRRRFFSPRVAGSSTTSLCSALLRWLFVCEACGSSIVTPFYDPLARS